MAIHLWLLPTARLALRKYKSHPYERNYVTSPSKADPYTDRGVLVIKTAVLSGFRAKYENQLVIKTHFWAENVQNVKKSKKTEHLADCSLLMYHRKSEFCV